MPTDAILRSIQDTFMIPLIGRDLVALVDERDFYELRRWRWYASWDRSIRSFYAVRPIPHPNGGRGEDGRRRRTSERMHRQILGLGYGDRRQVDHLNHNTLDNRRANLRIVDSRGNNENKRNQSRYGVGVQLHPLSRSRPFRAYVNINGKTRHIGMFATPEEAQAARKEFLEKKERT